MARPRSPRKVLEGIISRLEHELADPSTSKARRRTIDRQLLQATLGLLRLQRQQDERKSAAKQQEPKTEPKPEPEPALVRNLLGDPALAMHQRLCEAAQDESPSPDDPDAATATPDVAEPTTEDAKTEDPEPVRKDDDEPKLTYDLEATLREKLGGRTVRKHPLFYSLPLPGEIPPPSSQQPAPKISWWAGGPEYPELQKPTAVDNSDWSGNRIQDAQHSLRPKPELAHMDSPRRDLRQFLNDVAAGKDSGE